MPTDEEQMMPPWLPFPPLIPSILLCFSPSNVLLLMDEKGDQRRSATWSSCTVSPANYYMKNIRAKKQKEYRGEESSSSPLRLCHLLGLSVEPIFSLCLSCKLSAGKQWSRFFLLFPLSICLPFVLADKKHNGADREIKTTRNQQETKNKREEGERR